MAGEAQAPGGMSGSGKRPSALYNWVSATGLVLFTLGVTAAVTLYIVEQFARNIPAYLGILYLPALLFILAGMALFPIGYLLAKRKRARGAELALPLRVVVDLTLPRHRYVLLGLLVGAVVALGVTSVGSFQAFRALESNTFCGQACHAVMAPEAIAHGQTVHARVACVECHIGSGVGHYLRAKTAGMRRLVALATGNVQRPIPTPIQDMRPARETCESCHWPDRFIGYKERVRNYFISGEKSNRHTLRMLIKIGGADSLYIQGFGIHYHMQSANRVQYIARDRQRQEIAWVRSTRPDGTVREFIHEEFPLTDEQKKSLPVRTMDCLDCHNRPAHRFKAPVDSVDEALAAGRLPRSLPHIKVQAVKALDGKYESSTVAMAGIAERLTAFYQEEYPDVLQKQGEVVKSAVSQLQAIYKTSFFPQMKADWSAYPDNIGHRDWPGCFRCHTDQMKSTANGESIFTDCTKCHLILAQGPQAEKTTVVDFSKGKAFDHPGYGDTITEYSKCIDCHTGGADLY